MRRMTNLAITRIFIIIRINIIVFMSQYDNMIILVINMCCTIVS